MYYKLEPGSETYEKVRAILIKCRECQEKAEQLVKKLGFERFGFSMHDRTGGISCVESQTKPEGYVSVGKRWQNLYYPSARNKEVIQQFRELPTVSFEEFNASIGFEIQFVGLTQHRSFGVDELGEIFLITVSDDCKYTPAPGMVEILASEYKKLKEENKKEEVTEK